MKECLKVGFASLSGENIDEHFGRSENYYIYDVCKDSFTFKQHKNATQTIEDELGRLEYKMSLLQKCDLVVMTQIGPKASLLLKKSGINSMTAKEGMKINEFISKLQQMIENESKPLWLKQILLKG